MRLILLVLALAACQFPGATQGAKDESCKIESNTVQHLPDPAPPFTAISVVLTRTRGRVTSTDIFGNPGFTNYCRTTTCEFTTPDLLRQSFDSLIIACKDEDCATGGWCGP